MVATEGEVKLSVVADDTGQFCVMLTPGHYSFTVSTPYGTVWHVHYKWHCLACVVFLAEELLHIHRERSQRVQHN